mmetsp:Transcript_35284/g.63625  ORF Transcript_35284/g.63625 Transcript_35284/m.63625 type:complete len:231 (-) Transcript_35284:752-1444(-)
MRFLVSGEAILTMFRLLKPWRDKPANSRPSPRVEQVVHHGIFKARPLEHVQQLTACLHRASHHCRCCQSISDHAGICHHRNAGARVPSDLHRRSSPRIEDVGEVRAQNLQVVAGGGDRLPVSQLCVNQISSVLTSVIRPWFAWWLNHSNCPVASGRMGAGDLDVSSPVHVAGRETCLFQAVGHLVDGPALGQAAEVHLRFSLLLRDAVVRDLEARPLAEGRQALDLRLID